MKTMFRGFIAILMIVSAVLPEFFSLGINFDDFELVWSDEFDGEKPDKSKVVSVTGTTSLLVEKDIDRELRLKLVGDFVVGE